MNAPYFVKVRDFFINLSSVTCIRRDKHGKLNVYYDSISIDSGEVVYNKDQIFPDDEKKLLEHLDAICQPTSKWRADDIYSSAKVIHSQAQSARNSLAEFFATSDTDKLAALGIALGNIQRVIASVLNETP